MSRSEDWWKLLATGRPGFRGTCAVLWRSWACLAQAGSCAVSEKYRGCSNQAAAAQQNHTANRVIKTVAVVFGCHHIRSRTNSSASRSEDWWKLLATGRPGFRGTCAVFRDERTTRPATATRVSEVTPLCLFLSHGQASFPGRPPSSRYFNHHLRQAGTGTHNTHAHADRTWSETGSDMRVKQGRVGRLEGTHAHPCRTHANTHDTGGAECAHSITASSKKRAQHCLLASGQGGGRPRDTNTRSAQGTQLKDDV